MVLAWALAWAVASTCEFSLGPGLGLGLGIGLGLGRLKPKRYWVQVTAGMLLLTFLGDCFLLLDFALHHFALVGTVWNWLGPCGELLGLAETLWDLLGPVFLCGDLWGPCWNLRALPGKNSKE